MKIKTSDTVTKMKEVHLEDGRIYFWLKWTGLVSILVIGAIVVFDIILVTVPLPISKFEVQQVAEHLSTWRIITGFYGVLLFPFTLIAMIHLYLALKPAGIWYSLPPVILCGVGYLWGAVFHGALAYQLAIYQSGEITPLLAETLSALFVPLRVGFISIIFLSMIWLFVSIWKGKSRYPKWMMWVSPLIFLLIFRGLTYFSPPIIVGILVPAGNNIAAVLFLSISTWWFIRGRNLIQRKSA